MSTALKRIMTEVKRLRKKHPNAKYKTLQKQAGSAYRNGKLGSTRSKPKKKRKAAPRKKAKRKSSKHRTVTVVRAVRVVGQRKRKKSRRKKSGGRKVGSRTVRYRQVGGKGNDKMMTLLMIAALGVGAYLLLRKPQPASSVQLPAGTPPLVLTTNPSRNNAANNILSYAMAGGLAIDAITKLIQSLNGKSDTEVQQLNNSVQQGYGLPNNLFV